MSLPPGAPKNTTPSLLSDAEYDARTDALLGAIEATCDRWLQDDLIDIDTRRTGGLLEMHFPNGSKMVVDGGFHYRWDGSAWRDTRDGSEFVATLSRLASAQSGRTLSFAAISA